MDRRPDRLTTAVPPHGAPDADLLGRYAAFRSPDAFVALVDRYLPLIYSAALRQTRDPHLAEDAAQATLIILAQKAGRIDPAMLPGWLVKTAHYAARNAIRQNNRHMIHERRVAAMRGESHTPEASADPDALSRLLDPALARLRDVDRTAVVLRYFQDKSFAEIADQMRTTEGAVQRRIARAVEKLGTILTRQGATITPAMLPAFLATQTTHPIPPTFTARAVSTSTLKTASTSSIAKGALCAMAAAKIKVAAGIAAAVLLVGVAVPTTYHFAAGRHEFIPVPPPPAMPFSRPVSGSLPRGMVAEPFAVMRLADKRWFGPDGRERTDVPARVSEIAAANNSSRATHAFCIRIDMSGATTFYSWIETCRGAVIYHYGGDYRDPATGVYYRVMGLIPDPDSNSIALTIHTTDRSDVTNAVVPASATVSVQGTIAGLDFTAGPPVQVGDRTRLPVQLGPDTVYRAFYNVYAINAAGKRVNSRLVTPVGKRGEILEYKFDGTLSSFREFRVDSRPFNYHATYAPVPLAPVK